ncbi:MAG: hypothetical protein ABWX56_04485 [Mycetocola sp.]
MDTANRSPVVEWLLEGDPSVRWQVLRDLEHDSDAAVRSEREKIATSGWGARLLAEQGPDGRWANGLYSPKWTSTTYTLLLLLWLGLPRGNERALAGCRALWDGATFFSGGLTLARTLNVPEACITGMLVLLATSFGYQDDRIDPAVEWLLDNQLADGGWNCAAIRTGSTHSSFHTSITVLEALHAYASARGAVPVTSSMHDGREFFLHHSLYRSHRSGEIVDTAFTRFPFPPQWHFDVLRGLEHFRSSGAERDARLDDAIHVLRDARRADGRWPVHRPYPGRYWFALESPGPSRWATLRALRVLDWWEAGVSSGPFE